MCVRERERENGREGSMRERKIVCLCVRVCVYVSCV